MKPITSTLTLSLIRCHWLFHRIVNTGINPGIPGLQNLNPEIPGLGSGPGIANSIDDVITLLQNAACSAKQGALRSQLV